jgi:hypothetical protein
MLTIQGFYNYVFGENTYQKKSPKDKGTIKKNFEAITGDKKKSQVFRCLLRELMAKDLEDLLYGDHVEKLEDRGKIFPSDDDIAKEFAQIDLRYKYFPKDETAKKNFIALFKAAKLIADFVEDNNTTDNQVAYEHAYKMMVLFGADEKNPMGLTRSFVDKYSGNLNKPIHDSLVTPIPVNDPPVTLKSWQKFIQEKGSSVIKLFQQAPQIEEILGLMPKNLEEAIEQSRDLTYKRSDENKRLADLCQRYGVSEAHFNTCLEIKPKKSDKLPNVHINGADVEEGKYKGYHLVKLPVDDPSAYVLGHITNCCQSIGGHGEDCARDGITREKNGFYVLLKAKKGKAGHSPFGKDGKINYADYDIVGQAYAWLSKWDNMTCDSLELLNPSAENNVAVSLLTEFGKEITKEGSDIVRLTIGTGKTPKELIDREDAKIPERMAEGEQYGDSKTQSTIWMNKSKIEKEKKTLEDEFKKIYDKDIKVEIYSKKHAEMIKEIFLGEKKLSIEKNSLERIVNHSNLLEIFSILNHAKATENFKLVLELVSLNRDTNNILEILSLLSKTHPESISDENVMSIIQNSKDPDIKWKVSEFYKYPPEFTSSENINFLLQNIGRVSLHFIETTWPRLVKDSSKLATKENFNFLMQYGGTSHNDIVKAFEKLYSTDPTLITPDNRTLLANNLRMVSDFYDYAPKFTSSSENVTFLLQHIKQVPWGFINATWPDLEKRCPELATEENLKFLMQCGYVSSDYITALIHLYKTDPALITNGNRTLLVNNSSDVCKWYDYAPKLISRENVDFILQYIKQGPSYFIQQWRDLEKDCLELATEENFNFLMQRDRNNLFVIVTVLKKLYTTDPVLITDGNRTLLINNSHMVYYFYNDAPKFTSSRKNVNFLLQNIKQVNLSSILSACRDLEKECPELATEENFKFLIQCGGLYNGLYHDNIVKGLIQLYKTDPELITDENRTLLVSVENTHLIKDQATKIIEKAEEEKKQQENVHSSPHSPRFFKEEPSKERENINEKKSHYSISLKKE